MMTAGQVVLDRRNRIVHCFFSGGGGNIAVPGQQGKLLVSGPGAEQRLTAAGEKK